MKSIILKNVSYSYAQDGFGLKNINLQFEKGSYVSLIGHNGSGKSTIAKIIIGLLPLKGGEIEVNGLKLQKENLREIRKQIGIVFQNPDNQFIGSTVEEDIAFGLENRNVPTGEMQAIINEYASKVGMLSYLKQEPSTLSGGQKQRVAIAGVLALSPTILILDEATSMLDPKGKREILELINKIHKKNKDLTIISITHDVEETYLSDEVVVLKDGEVKYTGKPKELFSNKELVKEFNLYKPFEIEAKEMFESLGVKNVKDKSLIEVVEDYANKNK